MATVPVAWETQQTEKALPAARVESIASPALLDAGAEAMGKLGAATTAAGTGIAQVAFHMKQREDADVLFVNEAGDKAAYLAYEADLREKRKGNYAKGAAADTAAWWKDRISKNMTNMTSDQQRLYAQRISPVQLQSIHSVSQFEAAQTEIAHDQSWAADKVNTINLAAATPTPGIVETSMAEIKKFNSYQAARKGWAPEVLQAENGKDITVLHAQAIQTLAASDPAAAASYFKAHEMEIDGSKRAEIGEFAKKATAANVGATAAQAEWMLHGPKGDNDAANIDVMAQNIREQFKNDHYTRDAALAQLHQIDSERDKGIKARDANRTATVNSLLMGGASLAAVRQTPAWAALDGTEQRKILEHEESIGATREARAAARESRAYTATVRKEHDLAVAGAETYMRASNPDILVAMSRDQVINMRTTIGQEKTQHLLEKWDAFTKNGTILSEAKIDNNQFKSYAIKAGLDPDATAAKDKTMVDRVNALRDKTEAIIGSEQMTKKRPLTRLEKDKIMQELIDDTVIQHNRILKDEPVPAIALPADKQASAYVVVNGQEVKMSTIPADEQAKIIQARRAAGLPITQRGIAEFWLKKQNAKKPAPAPVELNGMP